MAINIKGLVAAAAVLGSPLVAAGLGYVAFTPARAEAQELTAFQALGGALTVAACGMQEGYLDTDEARKYVAYYMEQQGVSWERAQKIWNTNKDALVEQGEIVEERMGGCKAITDHVWEGAPEPEVQPAFNTSDIY